MRRSAIAWGLTLVLVGAVAAEEAPKKCVLFGQTTGMCSGSRLECKKVQDCPGTEICRLGMGICAKQGSAVGRSCLTDSDCPARTQWNSCLLGEGDAGHCSSTPEIPCTNRGEDVTGDGVGDDDCPKDRQQTCETACVLAYRDCAGIGSRCE